MGLPRIAEFPGAALTVVLVKVPVTVLHGSMHRPPTGSRFFKIVSASRVLAWAVQFTGSNSALTVLLYCLS